MDSQSIQPRWLGGSNASLGAPAIRKLKDHLFTCERALLGNGTEFLPAKAPGAKQPNTAKTGAILTVSIEWRTSSILCESVNRTNRLFATSVPYQHKSLFTCNAFTLLAALESHEEVLRDRIFHPIKLRPGFSHLVSVFWDLSCTLLTFGCRISLGVLAPVVSVMWEIPIRVTLITSLFATMSLADVTDFPFREVASFTMPVLVQTWDLPIEAGYRDLAVEWTGLFYFILFTLALSCCCSCEEILTMIYPVSNDNTAPPKPLSQLKTPVCSPPASDDDKTSGSTSDNDPDHDAWEQTCAKDGLFASVCGARCILIDGIPEKRLNPKVCKRRVVKLATLLDTDELYSSGTRMLPSYSGWVNAQLCTFRRGPYIQERDNRRCHVDDCFRSGVSITLFGTSTKRCRVQIEKALMAITSGNPAVEQESLSARRSTSEFPDPSPTGMDGCPEEPPLASASSSRRPSFNSMDSGGLSHLPSASETCMKMDKLHGQKRNSHDFNPTCWQPDVVIPDEPEAAKRPSLTYRILSCTWVCYAPRGRFTHLL